MMRAWVVGVWVSVAGLMVEKGLVEKDVLG